MIDYKYHIASLVAVFLSLGIGIIIGSTLLGNDALIDYQKQVTSSLEEQLQTLREANEEIQASANTLELNANTHKQFEKQVLPILVAGQLTGKNFAVVQLNGIGFPPELTDTIQAAGGTVSSIVTVSEIKDEAGIMADLQETLGLSMAIGDELYKILAGEISQYLAMGDNQQVIDVFTEKELFKFEGEYGVFLDGVIIVGGSYQEEERSLKMDIALIGRFIEQGLLVVGVEESGVLASSIKEYQLKHISTVDNIDVVPGQAAMVLVLGGQQGHFGVKSTAQQIMPDWPVLAEEAAPALEADTTLDTDE